MRRLFVVLAATLVLAACGRWGSHSKRAVEQAINEHLSGNTHLISSNFETEIENVSFKGDTATALVKFKSKQSAAVFVEVRYSLRNEKGRWEVVSSAPMSGQGGDSHGQGVADQPLMPPAGHPELPAGHPARPAGHSDAPAPQPSH
jgi:hypothetical protein